MAKQFLSTAAGKKVYSNGSHSPTRGRVNPAGYIKREQMKPPSQSRSGLAKAALTRVAAKKPMPRDPVRAKKPPVKAAVKKVTAPTAPKPLATPPVNPYISINSNGQLDLPYNSQYSWDVLNGSQDMNQKLLDLQSSQQSEAANYDSAGRNLDQQYSEQQLQSINDAAARGLTSSGLYANHVAKDSTNYNNTKTDLDTQHNLFGQNVAVQRLGIQNGFNDMLRQQALKDATTQSANAGSLGYGKTAIKSPAPIKSVVKAPVKTAIKKAPLTHPIVKSVIKPSSIVHPNVKNAASIKIKGR